jgi:putative ABC transport system substrate-binding protein
MGGAAAWPLAARAQQPTMPVVGYLRIGSRAVSMQREAAFRRGLEDVGYIEGRNIAIDYHYAENQSDRLPALAADLVRRQVAVIYAGENAPAVIAKAATTTIPIVFRVGGDPIQLGLVSSLNQPGSNVTGVTFLSSTVEAIRLQMLHEAVPTATIMGFLANATNPNAKPSTKEAQEAAHKLGLELDVAGASHPGEIDAAFATLVQHRVQALVINGDALFTERRQQLATLTARHAMPAIYFAREFPDAGGLMSYGASAVDAERLAGLYAGRVLKGEKPADLPIVLPTRFEFLINLQTAKTLGIEVPPTLLASADEVIE